MATLRVKICGITCAADAVAAAEAGADAIGLMFYAPSPRFLTLRQACDIIRELPPFVAKVGVFVNPSPDEVRTAIEESGIDTLQFHGDESPEFCRQFGFKTIKAFRIVDSASLAVVHDYQSEAWLLDSFVPGKLGGTGAVFNWELAVEAVRFSRQVILAGGLTPENAAEAVRRVRPFGLDVSSGVESAPGKKDPHKVRAFITAAKGA